MGHTIFAERECVFELKYFFLTGDYNTADRFQRIHKKTRVQINIDIFRVKRIKYFFLSAHMPPTVPRAET